MTATSRAAAAVLVGLTLALAACSSSGTKPARTFPVASDTPASSTASPSTSISTASSSGAASSTDGSSAGTTGAPSAPTRPVPATPLRTVTVKGEHATYTIRIWAEEQNNSCFDHAYGGPVITYLTRHPCHGLTRLLATTTVDGRRVGFAQSSLGFVGNAPGVYRTAGSFEQLVTKDGTGNIKDLFREGYRLPFGPGQVPSPDAFSALGQDAGATIVDAWYADGATPENDPALVQMAQDIFLQF